MALRLSIHGAVLVGGTDAQEGPRPLPSAGLSGRLTYATSDWFAYELNLEFEHVTTAAVMQPAPDTTWERRIFWLRGEAGISARLGAVWIPTLYMGVGVQARFAGQTHETIDGYTGLGPGREASWIPVGSVGVGLDYRLDQHWVAGVSLRGRHGAPWESDVYRAGTATVHLGYYWYPRNAR